MTDQTNSASTALPYPLVLASTSPFRKELLARLGLPFDTASPDIDETALPDESPAQLVTRLAYEKAKAVAQLHPNSLVIGSDQVACNDGKILGKPGSRENAIRQLSEASGKRITFYTGLCLVNTATQNSQTLCELFHVHFRDLDLPQIERYVDAEQPLNCAGSFKSEGLGISLFKKLEGDDPNALIGLPLIRLITLLQSQGVMVP
ncbi:MAG: Maf-like protein [Chromatiales bacterium]|nr:Maf-like protein [Chromatiales bacterium]